MDGPNDAGDMFERPGAPADRCPSPFPNKQAAPAANGGAYPPDFSVIAKARTYERGFPWFLIDIFTQFQEQGADYITALLHGLRRAAAGRRGAGGQVLQQVLPRPRHLHAAAAQRRPDRVPEERGRPSAGSETAMQYAKDVSAFLMWARRAAPRARKGSVSRPCLPASLRQPALLHQEAHLVARRRPRERVISAAPDARKAPETGPFLFGRGAKAETCLIASVRPLEPPVFASSYAPSRYPLGGMMRERRETRAGQLARELGSGSRLADRAGLTGHGRTPTLSTYQGEPP